jgi:hypothetical protein
MRNAGGHRVLELAARPAGSPFLAPGGASLRARWPGVPASTCGARSRPHLRDSTIAEDVTIIDRLSMMEHREPDTNLPPPASRTDRHDSVELP